MVTYTIGFSTDATTWPGASTIIAPTQRVPFGYDNSFLDFVTGNKTWPQVDAENKRALDLWHAALNGRGRFYAVMKGEDLEKAFREIVGQINTATDPDLSASATSGSNVSRSEVGKYTAAYEPNKAWKGFVTADRVKPDGTTTPDPGWGGQNTADKLDAMSLSSRLVLSWSDKWDTTKLKGGVPFKWASDEANLSTAQKLWLQRAWAAPTKAPPRASNGLITSAATARWKDPKPLVTRQPNPTVNAIAGRATSSTLTCGTPARLRATFCSRVTQILCAATNFAPVSSMSVETTACCTVSRLLTDLKKLPTYPGASSPP